MSCIRVDSRLVKNGDVFIAVSCSNVNTHIIEALDRGARVIFTQEYYSHPNIIRVDDIRLLESKLSRFQYPKQPEIAIAITGTNGKSSVAHFVGQIWSLCNIKSASLGTLGLFINGNKIKHNRIALPNLTTPDAMHLHQALNYLADMNINNFVFEASSIALDQKRLHSVDLTVAGVTNFASDHLDYHRTQEAYLQSKLILFKDLLDQNKPAVVSMDNMKLFNDIKAVHRNMVTFGVGQTNDIRAENIKCSTRSITFDLIVYRERFNSITINLLGRFQLLNVLCAVALAHTSGLPMNSITHVINKLQPLDGRMYHVTEYQGGNIFIDYAHTTEGFRNAVSVFKDNCRNKLICVFGCGGNRDSSKRAEIGRIAHELIDIPVVTDDNPRREDPAIIRSEIINTCPNAIEIGNRQEAIEKAIDMINPGDILAILGKGHESYQIYGTTPKYFNDREVVLNYINRV